jgi:hypothetical protein
VGFAYSLDDVLNPMGIHSLADRVLGGGLQCVRFDSSDVNSSSGGPSQDCTASNSSPGAACAANGLDRWLTWHLRPTPTPVPTGYPATINKYPAYSNVSCGKSNFVTTDPLGLCTSGVIPEVTPTSTPTPAVSPAGLSIVENSDASVTDGAVPVTPQIVKYGVQDTAESASAYDFLFVVSPIDVTISDMQNQNTKALQYWPYRFKTRDDCQSNDPDNPDTSSDCTAAQKLTYFLKLHDVSTAEDSSSSTVSFPICAIQPDP